VAYDEKLASRIRKLLSDQQGVSEKKMFGGIAFMLDGNMCCGVTGTALMLRLGKDGADAALAEEHVRPMDFTGKPMATMVYVDPQGTADDEGLAYWVGRAMLYTRSLPAK
jgi:TfoX/Sxy family transcriptional regulator of competence genes